MERRAQKQVSIARLLVDDLEAGFERVVREHAGSVVTFARRLCGDAADDVAQESFIRALRALRTMSSDDLAQLRVIPWLLTITRNSAYNHHRSASRRPKVVGELSALGVHVVCSMDPTPDSAVLRAESRRQLDAALHELSGPQREAVVLRHVLDVSTRDAAAVMGVSENTVKSHVARGLRALRDSNLDLRSES
jgi:RNA polymerase sigma factor (sigma-70 family)